MRLREPERTDAPAATAGLGLRVEGVTAGYGGAPVLRGVTVGAEAGEVVGLIGPNGSGKTTLVRVASRGLRPAQGHVSLAGVDPYSVPARAAARLIAVVPQQVTPSFSYSVLEMVLMGRAPYLSPWGSGGAGDWARVRRAMADAEVSHLADRPLEELSGGERQRVILAQALAQDAPILVLDEPTTHLDLRHVVDILSLVRSRAERGETAVLAIFHDLNLAAAYCDRLYALSEGQVVAVGTPQEVITRERVREVFSIEAEVGVNPASGRPSVAVSPRVGVARGRKGAPRVHVMGGAGSAASLLHALSGLGFEVTAGVLHGGDLDATVAERLGIARITVPPFCPVDPASAAECERLIRDASQLLVCDAPLGPGNVANLRLALLAAERGVETMLLERSPVEERDFTRGEATALWRELAARAPVHRSEAELVSRLSGGAPRPVP